MKKNIALIAGGDSGEYVISVNSASVIKQNLDDEKYNVFTILISGKKWVYLDDEGNEYPVDKNDFSINAHNQKIFFDCALITIHGTPGEDGKLQGYLELLSIPYTTSGILGCSLTFNKFFCNAFASQLGVQVARSVKFRKGDTLTLEDITAKISLPVFVKPNEGGSSLGTTFVSEQENLLNAIDICFEHDDEVLIEEFIEGTELTCGVYTRNGEVVVLPVTEIVSKSGASFFDYKAKYTKGAADEITPARVADEVTLQVQKTTGFLYKRLELKGVCRLDYIFGRKGLFFLEANITPGMSDRSIVPQQAAHMGVSMKELFDDIISEAIRNYSGHHK
jgi:D-alanine-D-alanine ligase